MKPRLTAAAFAVALVLSAPAYASDSEVRVQQTGNDNTAHVEQINSPAALAVIFQNGDLNASAAGAGSLAIRQLDAANATAFILQTGDQNHAQILQTFTNSDAAIRQNGDRNVSQVFQDEVAGNTGLVFQGGTGCLTVACGEGETFALGGSEHNLGFIIQSMGSDNSALVLQGGAENDGEIRQHGDGNFARLIQTGSTNRGLIRQGNLPCAGEVCESTRSDRGTVLAVQAGELNVLTVLQAGADNFVSAFQNGIGGGNTATIDQRGDSLRTTLFQAGHGNSSNVVQR